MESTVEALESIADGFLDALEKAKRGEIEIGPALRHEIAMFISKVALTKIKLAEAA